MSLELKAGQFKAEATMAEAKVEGLEDSVKDLDRSITKIPPDAAKAAAAMKLLGAESSSARLKLDDLGQSSTGLGLLDQRIVHTRDEVKRLADEFNRTGDSSLLEKMFSGQRDLRELEKLKKNIAGTLDAAGKLGGQEFGKSFSASIQGIAATPWVGPIIVSSIVSAIIAAAPAIGAALNGAVLGGIGTGVLALGIVGQVKSPMVHDAFVALGHDLQSALTQSTSSFAAPLVAAAHTLSANLRVALLGIDFQSLSAVIEPLARGVAGLVQEMGPGLRQALAASLPILLELARQLPQLGAAISDMLASMASGGQGAEQGFRALLIVIETVIRMVGQAIGFLSQAWGVITSVGEAITGLAAKILGWVPVLGTWAEKMHGIWEAIKGGNLGDVSLAMDDFASSASGAATATGGVSSAMANAYDTANMLRSAYDALNGKAIGTAQAQINMTQSVDALTQSMKNNAHSFDAATVKGAANLEAYLRGAQAARDYAQAVLDQTHDVNAANAAYSTSIGRLDAAARQSGATAAQVRGLHDQYASLPPLISTKVEAPGLASAAGQTRSFRDMLNDLNNRHIRAYVDVITHSATSGIGAQGRASALRRWGGITEHAETGLLRDASMYPATSPGRYMIAEPATGGEAFVPRRGDYNRSTAILDQAARWYGGRFAPGGGTGGGGVSRVEITLRGGDASTDALLSILRASVNERGGNVQYAVTGRAA